MFKFDFLDHYKNKNVEEGSMKILFLKDSWRKCNETDFILGFCLVLCLLDVFLNVEVL